MKPSILTALLWLTVLTLAAIGLVIALGVAQLW